MYEQEDNAKTIYQELCASYRAIDDFRAKLLGFLPLATGTGIFLLFTDREKMDVVRQFLLPIGVFGFVVTLGLFCYEIYGIRKCGALIGAGKQLERLLRIEDGQFTERPREDVWFINKPFAAGIIYPAVLAAWMYLALVFTLPQAAQWAPVLVFFVGFALTLIYDLWLRWGDMSRACKQSGRTHKEGDSAA